MELACPACGRIVPATDVNINLAVAKCTQCNNVFSFGNQLGVSSTVPPTPKRDVPKPERFTLENFGSELIIRWPWYTHGLWFLLFFCIFWDGFLVVWYSGVVFAMFGGKGMGLFGLVFLLFPLIHVAVGVGLTYGVLTGFLNRTVVRVSQGELSVRHGPIPYWGNHTLSTFDVSQLYVTESTFNGRRGRQSLTYDLNIIRNDGTKLKLIGSLAQLDEALFLEQQLEKHLKIEDEQVPGEAK